MLIIIITIMKIIIIIAIITIIMIIIKIIYELLTPFVKGSKNLYLHGQPGTPNYKKSGLYSTLKYNCLL